MFRGVKCIPFARWYAIILTAPPGIRDLEESRHIVTLYDQTLNISRHSISFAASRPIVGYGSFCPVLIAPLAFSNRLSENSSSGAVNSMALNA